MYVKKLSDTAILPARQTQDAAGFDIAANEDITVEKHNRALVKTGIAIQIPEGTYARIAPRSGLALKKQIDIGAGVVDHDYRGEIGVVMFNHGDADFVINKGDSIAQLILERICEQNFAKVNQLIDTDREGGFGSTGIAA